MLRVLRAGDAGANREPPRCDAAGEAATDRLGGMVVDSNEREVMTRR